MVGARASCVGVPEIIRSVAHARLKHTIVMAKVLGSTAEIAYCLRRGGYASDSARALSTVCVPRPPAEQPFRRAFERLRHPKNGGHLSA